MTAFSPWSIMSRCYNQIRSAQSFANMPVRDNFDNNGGFVRN